MGFTVTRTDGTASDREFRRYLLALSRVLLKKGADFANVPRAPENGTPDRWLYVWPTEAEAREFAELLNREGEYQAWGVREVNGAESRGPIRPLEVEFGWQGDGRIFALAPWARVALQARFPGSCRNQDVFIGSDGPPPDPDTDGELPGLTRQILPLLTGLHPDQLREFGKYQLTDPVTEKVIVPPTPI
jgi:hypothetical protein